MKKMIAFLAVFTVLAVGITYGCIQYTLHGKDKAPAAEQGIDLNGTYDENDLYITEIVEKNGDYNIYIPQIKGLKNEDVQQQINAELEREARAALERQSNHGYLSYQISANFGNVLSVGLYTFGEQLYLNFNLQDGSRLQLADLFAEDADLQAIVHGAFYDAFAQQNAYQSYPHAAAPDEQALYKTVKAFLNGEQKSFLFTPASVYLYEGGLMASVSMMDYAEDITVYTKYLGEESLFASDDVGFEGMFTCAQIPSDGSKRAFGFGGERFWYDICVHEPYTEDLPEDVRAAFLESYERVFAQQMQEVERIKALAEANPGKGYILLSSPYLNLYCGSERVGDFYKEIPSRVVLVNERYRLYEVSAADFDSKVLPALIARYRDSAYGLFYNGIDSVFEDRTPAVITKVEGERLVDYSTGNDLTVEDVFTPGYDWLSQLKSLVKYDLIGNYGFTMESAELAVQSLTYTLGGAGLYVKLPGVVLPDWVGEQGLWVSLSRFPNAALAIFD